MSQLTAAAWALLSAVEAGADQPALDAAARALRSALAEQAKPRPAAPGSYVTRQAYHFRLRCPGWQRGRYGRA